MIKTENAQAGPSKRIPTIPRGWEGTISSPIADNEVAVFLESFKAMIDQFFIPTKRHFQLLLYLSLTSSSPVPMHYLSQILNTYPPSALSHLIPCISTERGDKEPPYLRWEADADELKNELDRAVRKYVRRAKDKGIWALLEKRDRPKSKESGGEENEEGQRETVEISEKGWKVLSLFVEFWKRDREENKESNPGQNWSPLFLTQLPHPYKPSSSLQLDDASLPLSVVRSYLSNPGSSAIECEGNKATVKGILDLLISTTGSSAPFHPPSLLLSLISLLRHLPPRILIRTLETLFPEHTREHIAVILLEDLAGTRAANSGERSRGGSKGDFDSSGVDPFPPPTDGYLGVVLLLHPSIGSTRESWEKMMRLRMYLLESLLSRLMGRPNGGKMKGLEWVDEAGWREEFKRCPVFVEGEAGGEGKMGMEILDLLSQARRGK